MAVLYLCRRIQEYTAMTPATGRKLSTEPYKNKVIMLIAFIVKSAAKVRDLATLSCSVGKTNGCLVVAVAD